MKHTIGILLVAVSLLVAACGGTTEPAPEPTPTPPATPAAPVQPATPAQPAPEPEPTPTEPVSASSGDVVIQASTLTPNALTVAPGSTVTFRVADSRFHKLRVNRVGGTSAGLSPQLSSDSTWEFTFEEAGEYEIFDIILKGRTMIMVE